MHPLDRLRETRLLPVVIGLALVAIGLFTLRIAHILPPFIWASITAYILFPLVSRIQHSLRLPRALVIAAIYVVFIGLLVFVSFQLVPMLYNQVSSFVSALPSLIDTARQELVREPRIGIGGLSFDTAQLNARIDALAQQFAERFGREAVPLVIQTVSFLIHLLVYLLATFYFLLQGDVLIRKLKRVAPPRYRDTVDRVTHQVNQTFGAYIRAQLLLFVIVTVLTLVALSVLQVQYALAIAIASGVLELIPIVGPWSAAGIAMGVAVAQGSAPFGWTPLQLAAVVGLCYFGIRMFEDHAIIPQLVGRLVQLHPVLVIFGVLAGASIAGPLGLILAVPTLAALKIIGMTLLEELRHPPARRVVPLRRPGELQAFVAALDDYARQQVVLLIAPGAVSWDDLAAAQQVAAESLLRDIRLQAVTPDPVASSIATAAGIEVVTRVRLDEEAGVLEERAIRADVAADGREGQQRAGPQPAPDEPSLRDPAREGGVE